MRWFGNRVCRGTDTGGSGAARDDGGAAAKVDGRQCTAVSLDTDLLVVKMRMRRLFEVIFS
jgi:hypothetical protein